MMATEWYEMSDALDDVERNPEFLAKAMMDEDAEPRIPTRKSHSTRERGNAWTRERAHKKKMVRQFLSMNPAMDYSHLYGMRCAEGIYIHWPHISDGEYFDSKTTYCINPYTKIFLSSRGDLRRYRGNISYLRTGSFTLANKDKNVPRLTNKRIRKIPIDDGIASFSYYKKAFGPRIDDLW